MKSVRENILKYGTFVLVFVLPLIYYSYRMFPHIYPKTFFFYGSVEILAGFWLYSIILDKGYRLSKKSLIFIIPTTLYVIWMTLSAIFAINPELAFWGSIARGTGLLTIYHVFLFMFIIMSLVRKYGMSYVYSLMQWFVNGGFVLALSVWFGSTGFNLPFRSLMTDAGGGLAGNSSLTGAYFLFIIAFILCLLFSKSENIAKKWNITILVLIILSPLFLDLHGVFAGKSILGTARGAFLGIIVGLLTSIALYLALSKKKVFRILGTVSIFIGILSFGFLWNRFMTPDTYLHNKFIEVASGTRFIFWDEAQKAMDERPWFGYGPENYMIAFQTYFNPKMVTQEYNHEGWNDRAHNIYYDIGVSGGYPAILLYGLFLGTILYSVYKTKVFGLFNNLQISVIFGLVVGYVFENLFYFDSVLSLMAIFALGGIIFAVEINKKSEQDKRKKLSSTIRNIIAFIIFISIVPIWIYFTYSPSQKVKRLSEVIMTKINKPFDKLLSGSVIGNQWDVSGIAHDAYNNFARDPINTKNNKAVLPYIQKDLSNMIKYLEEIAKINKYDYRLYISMVHLYSTDIYLSDKKYDPILGKHVLGLLDHAKELAPTNPEVYWGIAQVNAWADDFNGIEKAYKKAISLDPTIPISYKLLIQFAQASGNKKLYEETILEAKKNIPNFSLN